MRINDTVLKQKTGKTCQEWFNFLDSIQALNKTHTEIAAYLCSTFGNDKSWYFQTITNAYEVARGRRKKHQAIKGHYEISVSKMIEAPSTLVFNAWITATQRSQWLTVSDITITKTTPPKSLRMVGDNGTKVSVDFYTPAEEKCRVVVQHTHIPHEAEAHERKQYWKEQLQRLQVYISAIEQ